MSQGGPEVAEPSTGSVFQLGTFYELYPCAGHILGVRHAEFRSYRSAHEASRVCHLLACAGSLEEVKGKKKGGSEQGQGQDRAGSLGCRGSGGGRAPALARTSAAIFAWSKFHLPSASRVIDTVGNSKVRMEPKLEPLEGSSEACHLYTFSNSLDKSKGITQGSPP